MIRDSAASAGSSEEILEPGLLICDPHHHIWDFPGFRYLVPDFLADVGPGDGVGGHRIESTIFVQCGAFYRQAGPEHFKPVGETETIARFAEENAARHGNVIDACAAIVGHADLRRGAAVDEVLEALNEAGRGRLRGIRHGAGWDASEVTATTPAPDGWLYRDPAYRQGFGRLAAHGLSFDAWQYHSQLSDLVDLANAFPDTKIMLDHCGGPLGIGVYAGHREEVYAVWRKAIKALGRCPNVWVKLGGLGMAMCGFDMPQDPGSAQIVHLWRPYIEPCLEAFGVERSMFESNFPADRDTCTYRAIWNAHKRFAAGASAKEKAKLFRDNARAFYRLD